MFLFAYPKPYFPGLPPYLPRYFSINFPKVFTSITGKHKFAIMLYRNIFYRMSEFPWGAATPK